MYYLQDFRNKLGNLMSSSKQRQAIQVLFKLYEIYTTEDLYLKIVTEQTKQTRVITRGLVKVEEKKGVRRSSKRKRLHKRRKGRKS